MTLPLWREDDEALGPEMEEESSQTKFIQAGKLISLWWDIEEKIHFIQNTLGINIEWECPNREAQQDTGLGMWV